MVYFGISILQAICIFVEYIPALRLARLPRKCKPACVRYSCYTMSKMHTLITVQDGKTVCDTLEYSVKRLSSILIQFSVRPVGRGGGEGCDEKNLRIVLSYNERKQNCHDIAVLANLYVILLDIINLRNHTRHDYQTCYRC